MQNLKLKLQIQNCRFGQSLIELLIAVGAISMILVALAAAATRAIPTQIFARQKAQATKLAQEQIERLRSFRDRQGWSVISNCDPCHLDAVSDLTISSGVDDGLIFDTWLAIADAGTNCPIGNKFVTAISQWGMGSNIHQAIVTTCLSQWKK